MNSDKVWLSVVESDAELVVYDGGGQEVARYKRTKPADGSEDRKWAEELATDVAGVVRVGLARILKDKSKEARFS